MTQWPQDGEGQKKTTLLQSTVYTVQAPFAANMMKLLPSLCLIGVHAVCNVDGWAFFPRPKPKLICKKNILVGAAGAAAAVIGTATIAGAAVTINQRQNRPRDVYEPPTGSLVDQVVLVTGASSGIGLETAKRLAAAGATVVLTSRTAEKGDRAVADVKDYLIGKGISDEPKLYNLLLDLDILDSVKQFPDSFKSLGLGDISVMINNAGVMAIPDRQLTVDGYERTFQSNHLGHFVLTACLFPYLSRDSAKVINVASDAYNFAFQGLDVDNLNGEKSYNAWTSYGLSKLSNILFTQELQKRADAAGLSWLTTVSLHPGVVNTELGRYIIGEDNTESDSGLLSLKSLARDVSSLFTKTPAEGASTQVFLAAADDFTLKKGAFYDNMKEKSLSPFAKDSSKAKSLWKISEDLGGIQFDLFTTAESSNVEDFVSVDEQNSEEDTIKEDTPSEPTVEDDSNRE